MNLKLPHLRTQATGIGLFYFRDEYSRVHVDEGDLESILEGKYIVHSPDYIGRTFLLQYGVIPKLENYCF
jgi:hypothetical protein